MIQRRERERERERCVCVCVWGGGVYVYVCVCLLYYVWSNEDVVNELTRVYCGFAAIIHVLSFVFN